MAKQIRSASMPRRNGHDSDAEFLRFFRDLIEEHTLRIERIESKLALRKPITIFEDMNPQVPSWEVEDVLMDTRLTKEDLQRELPLVFDSWRRAERAPFAVIEHGRFSREDRRLVTSPCDEKKVIDRIIERSILLDRSRWDSHRARVERGVDEWVDTMIRNGMSPEGSPHRVDEDFSTWHHSDFGAGRSRT